MLVRDGRTDGQTDGECDFIGRFLATQQLKGNFEYWSLALVT